MITVLKFVVIAVLGVAYLALAFVSAHPHTSPEYAAHYLHRTANCWYPWATQPDGGASRPAPPDVIKIGEIDYPEVCRYLRSGWFPTEDWGAWANPNNVILRVPPKPGARVVALTLRTAPPPGPAIRVKFSTAGQILDTTLPAGETRVVVLPLPPDGADIKIQSLDHAVIPALPPDSRMYRVNPIVMQSHPPPPMTRFVTVGLIAMRYMSEPDALGTSNDVVNLRDH
jgi:hypothetical protein